MKCVGNSSYSLVAALLFMAKVATRTTNGKTTEMACECSTDFMNELQPLPIINIKFHNDEAARKFGDNTQGTL